MAVTIKICGLSTDAALAAAIDGGADLAGFIFFEKSPRHIDLDTARALAKTAAGRIGKVAVTVNAEDDYLDAIVAALRPDFLQLHGDETPARLSALRARHGLPLFKAFSLTGPGDFDRVRTYEEVADGFLFDAKPPKDSALPGGNGVAFDWRLLAGYAPPPPYFLSGGLTAGNIGEALAVSGAVAVDISSGVETAPGVKDVAKIAAFIKTVKAFDRDGAKPPAGKPRSASEGAREERHESTR